MDDERTPKTTQHPWKVVRSYEDAKTHIIMNGVPDYISFDHDLGTEKTGYDFVKWLVDMDMNEKYTIPEGFEFNVHSANVPGKISIESYLNSYLKQK